MDNQSQHNDGSIVAGSSSDGVENERINATSDIQSADSIEEDVQGHLESEEHEEEAMEEDVDPEGDAVVQHPSIQDKGTCTTPLSIKPNNTKFSPGVEEEGQICSICFEEWTNSGGHKLVSLRCGHLFGQSCIHRWLRSSGSRCPQCNAPAKRSDIRRIFVRNLKVLDTAERDQAIKELETEKDLRRKQEFEMAKLKLKCDLAVQECERLKTELMKYKDLAKKERLTVGRKPLTATQDSEKISFVLEKTIELCKDGGCRVLTSSDFLNLLIASQPSSNNLFPGFGIKKISTLDFRIAEFVSIHQKPIKDAMFHSHDALVLTASFDRTAKLTNVISNAVVQTYTLPLEAWSCAWSKGNPCHFFTGLRNGDVLQFDTRMTNSSVCKLPAMGHKSPVVSLQYVQNQLRDTNRIGVNGLLSSQLSSCCLYEIKQDSDYRVHPLPLEGNFTSLSYEPSTGHLLVSCRPSSKHSTVTHMLCEMKFGNNTNDNSVADNSFLCNVVQVMAGGDTQAQLSKSGLFMHPSNESSVLVCAGDEKAQAALIWDACTGEYLQQLKVNDAPVFDVQFFRANQSHLLGTLTEKCLRIYRWND